MPDISNKYFKECDSIFDINFNISIGFPAALIAIIFFLVFINADPGDILLAIIITVAVIMIVVICHMGVSLPTVLFGTVIGGFAFIVILHVIGRIGNTQIPLF